MNSAALTHCSQCLVIHSPNDLRVETMHVGEVGAEQVVVRVAIGGICGSDLHYFHNGGFGAVRIKRPMILGHEVAGAVESIGAEVAGLKIGDRVAVNPSRPCGECSFCLEGLPNQCLDMRFYGSAMRDPHVEGAFRNLLVCDAVQCVPIAAHVSFEIASLAEPFSVALHAVSRAGSLLNKRVLVSGCGPIGALTIAASWVHGATEIVAVDVTGETLVIAREMGATQTINAAVERDWTAAYAANKGSFDVMFECSGNEQALRSGLEVMRPRGVVVQLGLGGDIKIPQNTIVSKELSICGSFRFHHEFALAVRLINQGRVDLKRMITHSFPLAHARQAFDIASDRKRSMKVLIDFAEVPSTV